MAYDPQINQVVQAILLMEREQVIHVDRLHRWMVALAETLQKNPQLDTDLKQHPFYDLGPAPSLRPRDELLQTIDALIQRLKD